MKEKKKTHVPNVTEEQVQNQSHMYMVTWFMVCSVVGEKMILSINGVGQLHIHMEKNESTPTSHHTQKSTSRGLQI